jgi:hypothetical protein
MLTENSFVLNIPNDPEVLGAVRHALADRLPRNHGDDDDVLTVGAMLVRQAQAWEGAEGPVRLRAATCGPVVHLEATRELDAEVEAGPSSRERLHGLVDLLSDRAERYTVSSYAGTLTLSAQRVVHPLGPESVIDLREAA